MAQLEDALHLAVNMYDPPVMLPEPKVINPLADLKEVHDVGAKNSWVSTLRDECTGTSVTHWTGDIRYKSLAAVRLEFGFVTGLCCCF